MARALKISHFRNVSEPPVGTGVNRRISKPVGRPYIAWADRAACLPIPDFDLFPGFR